MNATEYQYAFGFNKESALGTALATAKISKCLPMDGFAPIKKESPNTASDGPWFGKGMDWATWREKITTRYSIPSRAFALSPSSAIFAPSFVLGAVASTSVTTGVYDHVFTFQPKSNISCKTTTIIEKAGSEYAYKMKGTAINSFTLDMNRTDLCKISWEGVAVDRVAFTSTMPDVSSEDCYFKMLSGTFKIGTQGAPTTVTTVSLSGQITVSQNPNAMEMPGGSGLITQMYIGKQGVAGNLKLVFSAAYLAFWEADTECELEIVLTGDIIPTKTPYLHTVTINIKHLKLSGADLTQEGDLVAVQLNFDADTVFKHSTDDYIKWTVRTNIAATDILVNG
jgi:hypothetical protein